jgi:high potential iron-sulfur protein
MLVKVSDEWCLAFAIFLLRPWSRDHSVQVQLEGIIMTQDAKVPNSRQPTDSLPQLARRRILRSASGLASALALSSFFAPYGAIAKKKKTQAEVEYQQTPKGKEKCENCSFWVKPNQCTNVEGPIVAEGWCNIWISAD